MQASDLWAVDEPRSAAALSTKLDEAWEARVRSANEWNQALRRGDIRPGAFRRTFWYLRALSTGGTRFREKFASCETEWKEKTGIKKASLVWAMNDTLGRFFWSGGAIKV